MVCNHKKYIKEGGIMDNNVNKILFDKDKFTVEDLREAAKQIFEAQEEEFYAIKNEKWYKKFLNALSFGSGRNKKIVNDIRSLAKLQTIFALVYYENYKDTEKREHQGKHVLSYLQVHRNHKRRMGYLRASRDA